MVWASLGSVTPRLDEWRLFDLPDVAGKLFRVTQQNSIYIPRGFAWLAFSYLFGETSTFDGFKKIYPDWQNPGARLIVAPFPPGLIEAGRGVRCPAAKLHYRSVFTVPSWSLNLDVWTGAIEGETTETILAEVNSKLDILLGQ